MPDVAALQITADSKGIRDATVALREMAPAATAAEKASQRWGLATNDASRSADDFSRRVQGTLKQLAFEQQQLTRTAAEQAKYAALKRAGVTASSAEGRAIAASVAALQAQKAAVASAGEAHTIAGKAIQTAGAAAGGLIGHLKLLALAYISVEGAQRLWETAMKAGDLGEQAEQAGINTDQLQAYRLAAAQAGIESEQMDTALTKLARSMGAAKDGGKEMIERFQQLGVKLLDVRGELRPVADVLPEVAQGILKVGSSSERTAILQDLFGKSGAKMATVLKDIAGGNAALIASAREKNAIISPEAIEAWDTLGDRMKVTQQRFATLVAEFGAKWALPGIEALNGMLESTKKELEGIQSIWKWIMDNMDAAKRASVLSTTAGPAQADVKNLQDRLDALNQNPTQFGFAASKKALTDQLAARQQALQAAKTLANQTIFDMDENSARGQKLPVVSPPLGVIEGLGSRGAGSPAAKATGSDPYKKAIESAKEYTALKIAETAAVGLSVAEGERLKHTQELINKASEDANKLSPTQIANLTALAAAMADADAKLATAKFMDEAKTKSEEFIAQQQIERDTLWMSAEAADAYRIAQTALNDAKSKGIELSAADVAKLREQAAAQAAASQKTRDAKELYDLAKDSFTGFIADMRQGLMDGKSVWETFGNAATNALDKISSKLLEMAAQKLFESAFGGSSGGGGGGFLGSILGGIFGGGAAGGGAGPLAGIGSGMTFANGAAFQAGNVVRFATGGIVNSPTNFAMSGGRTGLMGEAGAEGILPLHRGRDGGLGVRMSGGGTAQQQPVNVVVTGDTDLVRVHAEGAAVRVYNQREPSTVGKSVKQSTRLAPAAVAQHPTRREGEWRTAGAG